MIKLLKKWISARSLRKARRKANKKAVQTGRRFYVLPMDNNKLAVVDNSFMKIYNRHAKRKLRAHEFKAMAIYATPWTTKSK